MQGVDRYRRAVEEMVSRRQGRKTREPVTGLLQARYQGNGGLFVQANKGRDVKDYRPIQQPGTGRFYFMWGYDRLGDPCHPMAPAQGASVGGNGFAGVANDYANPSNVPAYTARGFYPAGAREIIDTRTPVKNFPPGRTTLGVGPGSVTIVTLRASAVMALRGYARLSGPLWLPRDGATMASRGFADLRQTEATLRGGAVMASRGVATLGGAVSLQASGSMASRGVANPLFIYQNSGGATMASSGGGVLQSTRAALVAQAVMVCRFGGNLTRTLEVIEPFGS